MNIFLCVLVGPTLYIKWSSNIKIYFHYTCTCSVGWFLHCAAHCWNTHPNSQNQSKMELNKKYEYKEHSD